MSICPRCKRPLDDEEPYICCAGVELRWRCTSCHKVAEGFAFPYGLCPYCKGKLELLDRGAIEGDEAMEAIRKAFEIELGGRAFYQRASQDAKDPYLRDLFARFAAMEDEHMQTLSKRYHAELPDAVGRLPDRPRRDLRRHRPQAGGSRPTCSASRSRSNSARWTSSPARARRRRTARSSASSTGSSPPRSASTWNC